MLRFFRFNDPYRLLIVFVVVVILGIKNEIRISQITLPEFNGVLVGEMMADGKSMYSEVWHSMPPVTAYIQYLHDLLFGRSLLARHIVALLLIFFQAAFFGVMLINNRAFNDSNYLPSFVMVVITFFSFDTVSITGEIIGSTLLLLAINNLLKEIEFKQPRDETIHNLGFFLGLATLAVFSYLVFFIGVILILLMFTRITMRRMGLFTIGFLLPHLIINIWYYWNNNIDLLWSNFYLSNFEHTSPALIGIKSLLVLSLIPCVYLFFSLIMMRRDSHLTKYQSQIAQVMFLWLIFGLAEVYLNTQRSPQALLVCVPPLAYYISHYFLLIKRKWIAETMLWFFLIGTIGVNSLSSHDQIPKIDYSGLIIQKPKSFPVEGKKVLVLHDDFTPYLFNSTSSYFLDWKIYQSLFKEPNVYQHIVVVATAFEEDAPEVIIDPHNHLAGIIQYIPEVRQKYIRKGNYYFRIP